MAEGGARQAGDDRPKQPFLRYYDAPTTPLPRVSAESLAPPVPGPGARDKVRSAGRATGSRPGSQVGSRVGELPLRLMYTLAAALVAVVAVVVVFLVFSGDKPEVADGGQGAAAAPASPASPTPSPSPSPTPIVLPKVPASRPMPVFPGTGTAVASYVLDRKAGISYAKFGRPWTGDTLPPFASGQRAGDTELPLALIGSAPLPGAAPGALTSYDDYRKVAARAARWSLRYQPEGAKVTWTASQPVRRGMGWLLGYKATYRIDGEKHSAQAFVMVVGTGRTKPALLFATVPDDREELYRDLDMLSWTVTPI
ncbi:hypothetical protein GCM10009530_65030 [Microbispora corallina]|uniref:Serine/threonine protein kinase n=1 Tax=Microbispora corallina TaxID=83302 RepID=A0ABQ4G9B9_9ACTN|nr:hypothetical protein [Microbispora corallina]GIH43652.1 hypothetical protein Mco01_66520 [Microbispora corallina]